MATMKDVAMKAGVSVATVSNVINGKQNVTSELTERVLKAIKDCDFHVNLTARGLKTSKSKTIGVVLPDMTKIFFNEVMRGILEYAESHGYRIIVLNSYYNYSTEKECIASLRSSNVDGIILDSCCDYHQLKEWACELSTYEGRYTPIVFLENSIDDDLVSSVTIDAYYWSGRITQYLISHGRKRILFVCGPLHLRHERDRYYGYEQTLKDNGIKPSDNLIIQGDFSSGSSYSLFQKFLLKNIKFDAVQASSDEAAIGVLKVLKEHGYHIPEDILICGFDDLFPSSLVDPGITTVRVPKHEIGYEAVKECIHLIEDPSLPRRRIVLSSEMIIRGSTDKNSTDTSWNLVYW